MPTVDEATQEMQEDLDRIGIEYQYLHMVQEIQRVSITKVG